MQRVAVRLEERLVAAVVVGPPDVLEPDEGAAAADRVGDERHVERPLLAGRLERVVDREPLLRVVPVEVHLGRGVVVVVVADRRRCAASKPDWPPSPPTTRARCVEPVYENVPLSCVPPSSSPVGLAGLNDSDWNWIVFSPSLSGVIARRDRRSAAAGSRPGRPARAARRRGRCRSRASASRRPRTRCAGCARRSRTTPPSEPTNAMPGSAGSNTTACWSGWMPCVNA